MDRVSIAVMTRQVPWGCRGGLLAHIAPSCDKRSAVRQNATVDSSQIESSPDRRHANGDIVSDRGGGLCSGRRSGSQRACFQPVRAGHHFGSRQRRAPTFSPDGKTISFSRSSGRRRFLVTSRRAGGRWAKPEIASFAGPYSDQQPAFSPDGHFLFMVHRGPSLPASSSLRIEMIFSSENRGLFIRVLQGKTLLPSGPDRQEVKHGLKFMASCNNRGFAHEA